MPADFDYIIVGSGAGGSTMAYRLATTGRNSVLVLEYGDQDTDPLHRVPLAHFATEADERYAYHYATEPAAGAGRGETWIRGRVVGGSTTINAMMYSRGQRADFDHLAAHAGSGHWSWDNVLAAYRAMEDHELGASAARGTGGPFGVSVPAAGDELADLVFGAGKTLGLRQAEDINDSDDERIGHTPAMIRGGVRSSAASAFLRPALRAGVTLETGVRAERVLLAGDGARRRAVAVAGSRGGTAIEYRARKEVIVACGTVETPLLLERSGIGQPSQLRRLGIATEVESPSVGERVIEQRMTLVQVHFTRPLGAGADLARQLARGITPPQASAAPSGVLARSGYDFTFYVKSDLGLPRPDLVGHLASFAVDPAAAGFVPAGTPGMLLGMYQLRPETAGSVHLSGAGPSAPPVIRPRYIETDADRRAAGQALARLREFLGAAPLAEVIEGEDFPGAAVPSDAEAALAYVRRSGGSAYHAVGSCALGPDDGDVLDRDLRVRGVAGLRVVDASALPFQMSANPTAPVMALAWLAADLLD